MSLTPENEELRASSSKGERGSEGIGTSDSHTSGISPRGAIFSPHGNCVRRCSGSQSSEVRPEAGDGATPAFGPSARPWDSMVSRAGDALAARARGGLLAQTACAGIPFSGG